VICPGGGYSNVVIEKEGWRVARELQKRGIAGVVLKYRYYDRLAAVQDAHRAVRYVRSRAAEWHLDLNAVGIGGFSAGGHLSLNMAARLKEAPSPIDGAVVSSSYPPTFIVSAADDPKMKAADMTAFFDRLQVAGAILLSH
jgi:acetyl esterase/lipase